MTVRIAELDLDAARLAAQEFQRHYQYYKAEVDRLQAIVDKLPKCWRLDESGKRVQDVPVVPGMEVYWMYATAAGGLCGTSGRVNYVTTWTAPGFRRLEPVVVVTDNGDPLLKLCCATRKAAEAAREEITP